MGNTINMNGMTGYYNSFIQSVTRKNTAETPTGIGNNAVGTMGDFKSAIIKKTKVDSNNTSYIADCSFKNDLKSKYPGACYNVMDTSKIDHGLWGRNDYPWDAYFSEPAYSSVLDWTPTGTEPSMQDSSVVSKINSMAGKLAVVVPPELEIKMQSDEELAHKVMERVDDFISKYYRPDANQGFLITFDENGNIGESCITCEGRVTVSSSEFVEERKAREKKTAEYERIAEENAIKRRMVEKDRAEEEHKRIDISKGILRYSNAGIIE